MATAQELAYESLLTLLRSSQDVATPEKPLLWLGAGASAYDGAPVGDALSDALVGASGAWGSPQYRLDRLFEGLPPAARLRLLRPLLEKPLKPDSPYLTVVRLMMDGYIGGVVTFNVDSFIDLAVRQAAAFGDVTILDGVEMLPNAVFERFFGASRDDRLVLKLHGALTSGLNLFTSLEIAGYSPKIHDIVGRLSQRPAVVCGYSFAHLNALRAFSAEPSAFYYCDPVAPRTPALLSLMEARGGVLGRALDGAAGHFDAVMSALDNDLP